MILDGQNFHKHLSEKNCKANKGIGLIKSLHNNTTRKHLILIYKSHARPHLEYGDFIYDNPDIDNFINLIKSAQYNAAIKEGPQENVFIKNLV